MSTSLSPTTPMTFMCRPVHEFFKKGQEKIMGCLKSTNIKNLRY